MSHFTHMLLHLLAVFSDGVKVVVWDNIILAERVLKIEFRIFKYS